MFSTANVRTDVVEAKHVFTAGPVMRLVTSQARDSRAHASHTSREDFAKPVSLIPTCFIICLMGYVDVVSISVVSLPDFFTHFASL